MIELKPKRVVHRCIDCGREYPHSFVTLCQCGHLVEVFYDLAAARLYESDNPYIRYFDLLPIENPSFLLPVEQRFTPCIHAEKLGRRLGLPHLYLKDETVLPTGSTKDRMAVTAMSFMREVGVKAFVTSSTGNSSSAFAYYLPLYPECQLNLFTGERFVERLAVVANDRLTVFGMRDATFVEACEEAKAYAHRHGLVAESGFFNPARRDGLKTALLEAHEQVPRPIDWYVQAVSSAMGVYGCHKGSREFLEMGIIKKLPRLLCVQQNTNPPMATAFAAGSRQIRATDIVPNPHGLAEAILRGDPSRVYPYVFDAVSESQGTITAVSAQEIIKARQMVSELAEIPICYTAATAMAGLIRNVENGRVSPDQTILVNLTGRDRTSGPNADQVHWLCRNKHHNWIPESTT